MAVTASCDTGAESRRTDTNRRGRDMALTSRRGRPCPATRSAAHVVVAPVGFLQRGLVAVVQDADQSPAAMLARAGLKEHGRDPIAHRLLVAVLEGPVVIGAGFGYRRVVRADWPDAPISGPPYVRAARGCGRAGGGPSTGWSAVPARPCPRPAKPGVVRHAQEDEHASRSAASETGETLDGFGLTRLFMGPEQGRTRYPRFHPVKTSAWTGADPTGR